LNDVQGARAEAPASGQRSCLANRFDRRLTAELDETHKRTFPRERLRADCCIRVDESSTEGVRVEAPCLQASLRRTSNDGHALASVMHRLHVYDSKPKRMSRRSRSRNRSRAERATNTTSRGERRDRMARVQVSDEVWADFRTAAGNRPISEVLGELVSREVDRYRSKRLRQRQLEPSQLVDALEDARRQQQDLAVLVARLERLHQPR
jgi:hypothetical protein